MHTGQDDAAGRFVAAFGNEGLVRPMGSGRLARAELSG